QLPNLQADIHSLADPNSQTHPTFENTFRYTRMTAKKEMRQFEKRFFRTPDIAQWSIMIQPQIMV
ncbi:hypothetical protein LJC47_00630, partial [Desulfosarcina sp. OttesenSCG-928-B08]|nr:hypothetical protein [Desulfosarcina sp. OttesenSCG-928-B08]